MVPVVFISPLYASHYAKCSGTRARHHSGIIFQGGENRRGQAGDGLSPLPYKFSQPRRIPLPSRIHEEAPCLRSLAKDLTHAGLRFVVEGPTRPLPPSILFSLSPVPSSFFLIPSSTAVARQVFRPGTRVGILASGGFAEFIKRRGGREGGREQSER